MSERLMSALKFWLQASKDLTTGFFALLFFISICVLGFGIFLMAVTVWLLTLAATFPLALYRLFKRSP